MTEEEILRAATEIKLRKTINLLVEEERRFAVTFFNFIWCAKEANLDGIEHTDHAYAQLQILINRLDSILHE